MPAGPEDVTLRPLASPEDYAACVELQRETWGRGFEELVPGVLFKICQQVGGVAAGAFGASGFRRPLAPPAPAPAACWASSSA